MTRHNRLLQEITECRMTGKSTRRRIQILHDLANDGGFVTLKQAAEDREGWIQRKDVKNLLYSRRLLMVMMALLVDVCLFAWCLTALSADIGYIVPQAYETYIV